MYAGLQLRVGLYRKDSGVSFGTAAAKEKLEDMYLTGISRAGANMGEYVPTALFLMFLMESQAKVSRDNLIAFGSALAAARILHATALSTYYLPAWRSAHLPLRALGFLSTIGLITGAGVFLVRWSMKQV